MKEVVKVLNPSLGQKAFILERCFYLVSLKVTLVIIYKMVHFKKVIMKYGLIFWRKSPLAERILLLQKRVVRAIILIRL